MFGVRNVGDSGGEWPPTDSFSKGDMEVSLGDIVWKFDLRPRLFCSGVWFDILFVFEFLELLRAGGDETREATRSERTLPSYRYSVVSHIPYTEYHGKDDRPV